MRKTVTNGSSHILPWANDSGAGGCRREATRIVWTIDQAPLSGTLSLLSASFHGEFYTNKPTIAVEALQATCHLGIPTPSRRTGLWRCTTARTPPSLVPGMLTFWDRCGVWMNSYMLIQWEGRIPGNAMGTVASHYSCNLTLEWCSVGSGRGGFGWGCSWRSATCK